MKSIGFVMVLAVLVIGCSGCSGESPGEASGSAPAPAAPPAQGSGSEGARTLPIPGAGSGSGMPSGHPPVDGAGGGPLAWSVPDSWVQQQPSSNMRWAQYQVPGAGGDGECIVFYFGPGQGGDPASNAQRWAGQFTQPDGRSSTDAMLYEKMEGTRLPVHIVEVTGTYDGGMSGPMDVTGYMLLGGIVEGPDAPWFFKLIGPEATVRAQRAGFLEMMESVRADG